MPNRSSLIAPNKQLTCHTEAETPPFSWATVHQTVLKFVNPLQQQTIAAGASAEHVFAAMQRLVAMIDTLRSSPLPSSAEPFELSEAQTLEALLPYVSEEAYDVLDALRSQEEATLHTPHPTPHTLITIDTLIPSLLWSLARSSYSAMHLIEGVRVKCWQPEQGWALGMLRLVVMLEAEAPTVRWCFDLATGYPAESLLASIAIVQSDEWALPMRCAAVDASLSDSPCEVQHQLRAILQRLQTEVPGLGAFLQGVAIELLQPGADWQAGTLRLQFGFAFSAQAPDVDEDTSAHSELIEVELMDEAAGIAQSRALQAVGLLARTHIIVNPMSRSLSPATLIRVAEAELEHYTQQTARQPLEQSLVQLRSQQNWHEDESAQLALVVQAAIASCARPPGASGIGLRHPMLLMDELVPKLLWSITSSTYDSMQLVGGLSARVLQPNATWQQGTLRLLAALHLKAVDVDEMLDLSTGRSVDTAPLDVGAIVQTSASACSQPTAIETLTAHLQQQLYTAVPEYKLLMNGVAMAWLEDVEQDWQSGTMTLSVSLAFVPDAR